jgi:hypothetical protein
MLDVSILPKQKQEQHTSNFNYKDCGGLLLVE